MLKSAGSTDTQKFEPPIGDRNRQMDLRFLVHLAGTGATDIHPLGRTATTALIERLRLHPGLRVLDVGCGTGGTMVRLARYNPARIEGVDVTPAMLSVARKRIHLSGLSKHSAVHLMQPGGSLPFAGASFDRVYTESVLGFQDADGAKALLQEIYRVLKPGGVFAANEAIWRTGTPPETIAAINASCLADFGLRMASDPPWALDEWLGVMKEMGFQVLSADLITASFARNRGSGHPGLHVGTLASAVVTRFYWLRSHVSPADLRVRAHFRRLNRQHREDGAHIEPRLFVLQKPQSAEAADIELSVK